MKSDILAFEQCPTERKISDFQPLNVQKTGSTNQRCVPPVLLSNPAWQMPIYSFLKLLFYRHMAKRLRFKARQLIRSSVFSESDAGTTAAPDLRRCSSGTVRRERGS